jgi:rSAM/selenodomain-associated transferase 2
MLSFSVIIPALNEEAGIGRCVAAVRALEPDVEVIVVDGGSGDRTVQAARQAGATVVRAARGRGPQCNAGARAAAGDVLLFLHADTFLPEGAFALLQDVFADGVQVAKFQIRFDQYHWFLAACAKFSRFETIMTSFGDQGIVVRRSFFAALGGFPDWPIYEDVGFFQRARRRTRVRVLPAYVLSSARRFVEGGFYRQLFRNLTFMGRYLLGMRPQRIAELYEPTNQRGPR